MAQFQSRPLSQNQSRLIMLPGELRTKILRNLLYHTESIPCLFGIYSHEFEERTQKTAQLLRTCQQLQIEGSAILYGENTLDLCVDTSELDDDDPEWFGLDILDCFVGLPNSDIELGPDDTLFSYCAAIPPCTQSTRRSFSRLLTIYPSLVKFDKVSLDIHYSTQTGVFMACRLLVDLLFNKTVTVQPAFRGDDETIAEESLKSLCFLECKSLCLKGYEDSNLEEAGTRKFKVNDVYHLWRQFSEELLPSLPLFDGESFSDKFGAQINELRSAMMNYEKNEFEDRLAQFMDADRDGLVSKWIKYWQESEMQRLTDELAQVEGDALVALDGFRKQLQQGEKVPRLKMMDSRDLEGK